MNCFQAIIKIIFVDALLCILNFFDSMRLSREEREKRDKRHSILVSSISV